MCVGLCSNVYIHVCLSVCLSVCGICDFSDVLCFVDLFPLFALCASTCGSVCWCVGAPLVLYIHARTRTHTHTHTHLFACMCEHTHTTYTQLPLSARVWDVGHHRMGDLPPEMASTITRLWAAPREERIMMWRMFGGFPNLEMLALGGSYHTPCPVDESEFVEMLPPRTSSLHNLRFLFLSRSVHPSDPSACVKYPSHKITVNVNRENFPLHRVGAEVVVCMCFVSLASLHANHARKKKCSSWNPSPLLTDGWIQFSAQMSRTAKWTGLCTILSPLEVAMPSRRSCCGVCPYSFRFLCSLLPGISYSTCGGIPHPHEAGDVPPTAIPHLTDDGLGTLGDAGCGSQLQCLVLFGEHITRRGLYFSAPVTLSEVFSDP